MGAVSPVSSTQSTGSRVEPQKSTESQQSQGAERNQQSQRPPENFGSGFNQGNKGNDSFQGGGIPSGNSTGSINRGGSSSQDGMSAPKNESNQTVSGPAASGNQQNQQNPSGGDSSQNQSKGGFTPPSGSNTQANPFSSSSQKNDAASQNSPTTQQAGGKSDATQGKGAPEAGAQEPAKGASKPNAPQLSDQESLKGPSKLNTPEVSERESLAPGSRPPRPDDLQSLGGGADKTRTQFDDALKNGTFNASEFRGALKNGADFSGMDLSKANLNGQQFEGGNLSGSSFPKELKDASFKNMNLSDSNFSSGDLNNVKFEGSDLSKSNFHGAKMNDVKFEGSDLSGSKLDYAQANNLNVTGGKMDKLQMTSAQVNNSSFNQTGGASDFRNTEFNNTKFNDVKGDASNFKGSRIKDSEFNNGSQKSSDFDYLNTRSATRPTEISNTKFNNTNLAGPVSIIPDALNPGTGNVGPQKVYGSPTSFNRAQLHNVTFDGKQGYENTSFDGSTINQSTFNNQNLNDANFSSAQIKDSSFADASLTGTRMNNANISDSKFDGADMRGVEMNKDTQLNNNSFKDAKYTGGENFPASHNYEKAGMQKGSLGDIKDQLDSHSKDLLVGRQDSVIQDTRSQLKDSLGVTGKGRHIGILDGRASTDKQHGLDVENRINGAERFGGLAPGAKTTLTHLSEGNTSTASPDPIKDTEADLKSSIDGRMQNVYGTAREGLQHFEKPENKADAVNMSIGYSRLNEYKNVDALLNQKGSNGDYSYPNMRQAAYGDLASGSATGSAQKDRMADYVDKHLGESPAIQKAAQEYKDTTQRLWDNNTIPVISTSNDHRQLSDFGLGHRQGADFNLLAENAAGISVGASSVNGTPGDVSDDKIAGFSSQGNGKNTFPTLAAPGDNVAIGDKITSGTSFSAPVVSSVVGLMREANPNLTSSQVRDIMTRTATDTPAGREAEGAGMLNPTRAVQEATRMNMESQWNNLRDWGSNLLNSFSF